MANKVLRYLYNAQGNRIGWELVDETSLGGYVHPATHPPSIIEQDINNRFVTDAEKTTWDNKQNALGFTPADENHNHDDRYYTEEEINFIISNLSSGSTPTSWGKYF